MQMHLTSRSTDIANKATKKQSFVEVESIHVQVMNSTSITDIDQFI